MTLLLIGILTYAALVLETAGGSWPLPPGTMPQFLFLAAAIATLRCRGAAAVICAAVIGLLADVVHGGPLGLHVVLLANLTFISQLIGSRRSSDGLLPSAAFVLLYAAAAGIGGQVLHDVLSAHAPSVRWIATTGMSRAGGTAAVYLAVGATVAMSARSLRWMIPGRRVAADRPRWAQ